ncbi:hypothetical protein L1887_05049 [Cichorium endivia]|nr:hypothetical protein L1887_05049 [Cichorium endivia]
MRSGTSCVKTLDLLIKNSYIEIEGTTLFNYKEYGKLVVIVDVTDQIRATTGRIMVLAPYAILSPPPTSWLLGVLAPFDFCEFELQTCDTQLSIIDGAMKEFIFSGRIDNYCMCLCSLKEHR